ncbi:MAG: DoxX family protein [Flavobacteriaceae bacterium]|nr:DoxX family protein [Flavobacteriaceae bacterium]
MLMKIIVHILRVFVGALFIFSGAVKVVDPIGSQYKFEEYFSASVLDLEFLIPYALPFAIILIVAEIVLGAGLIVGWKSKFTVRALLVTIVFFTFLTWYSAYYNKVTDCGCFGDAIKLKPWETFYKDAVLLVAILILNFRIRDINPIDSKSFSKKITFLALFISACIVYYVLNHLPIIDFRPYAIGENIEEGMKFPEDGSLPKVHDFMLEDSQNDLAPMLLRKEKLMLVIMYNISKTNKKGLANVKEITRRAKEKGYVVYGVSASFDDDIQELKKEYSLPFEFLFCDETTLKTMIRANPGVMLFERGTVTDKKNWNDVEDLKL